jgi:hypothetical protein
MKVKKGYIVERSTMQLRTRDGVQEREVWILSSKRKKLRKVFIDERAVQNYLNRLESDAVVEKALAGVGAPTPGKNAILRADKDLRALKELNGEYDDEDSYD